MAIGRSMFRVVMAACSIGLAAAQTPAADPRRPRDQRNRGSFPPARETRTTLRGPFPRDSWTSRLSLHRFSPARRWSSHGRRKIPMGLRLSRASDASRHAASSS